MWDLDHKEGWAQKNWCFWILVLEKTLESNLYSKMIKPVNSKGNQPWISIHWKERRWSWSSNTLATWCEGLTLEKTLMVEKTEGRRRWQRMWWQDVIINTMDMSLRKLQEIGEATTLQSMWSPRAGRDFRDWTTITRIHRASQVVLAVKNPLAKQEMQKKWVWSLGGEDPLEGGVVTHSSILSWKIPWTEDPGRLQSMGSQRVRLDLACMPRSTSLVTVSRFGFEKVADRAWL